MIAFQPEAFADFEALGIQGIDPKVYESYRSIREESYSGRLLTNIFAGGTVNTEWSFLTGYPQLPKFIQNVNSYVWYLKDQGYKVSGSHTCFAWYYNRTNINQWLGFDDYLFIENYYNRFNPNKVCYDDVALREMLKLYQDAAAGDEPVFQFNVTYQGHGPYHTDIMPHGDSFWSPDGYYENVSDYTRCVMNNYLWSLMDTGDRMLQLLDALKYDSEPVVVILYGDHMPWLGDSNKCYQELGVNINTDNPDGLMNYYSTEYVIWANEAAKEVLEKEVTGRGPTISSCFMMNVLFDYLGWQGDAYMQYTDTVFETLPVVSSKGYYMDHETIFSRSTLTEEHNTLLAEFMNVQYYWSNHYVYG